MPRLPPTPHSMEANEPCLGRWVHDDASGLEGLVIEVKTGGWRVVLSVDGNSVNRRSGALEYAAGEPPAELVNTCQQDYGVPYAPATEAMRKKVLSRRRQEEIYKPRAKPPGAGAHWRPSLAPATPAPRATLTSQKVRAAQPPRRRQRYDDDGDVRMMPPPAPSETNQLATGPVSAAQEARDLAEALRRSREDAAPAPAPAPDPNAFSGHALLQGFMQA